MMAKNSFWYRLKTPASAFPLTKLARYSMLSLRPRNMAQAWGFVSAERLLRRTVAGCGRRTTSRAEHAFISRSLFLRILEACPRQATDDIAVMHRPSLRGRDFAPVHAAIARTTYAA